MDEHKPQWMIEHEAADAAAFKAINDKLDSFMDELRPFIQGATGLGVLWKGLVALGGLVLIYIQIRSFFTGH